MQRNKFNGWMTTPTRLRSCIGGITRARRRPRHSSSPHKTPDQLKRLKQHIHRPLWVCQPQFNWPHSFQGKLRWAQKTKTPSSISQTCAAACRGSPHTCKWGRTWISLLRILLLPCLTQGAVVMTLMPSSLLRKSIRNLRNRTSAHHLLIKTYIVSHFRREKTDYFLGFCFSFKCLQFCLFFFSPFLVSFFPSFFFIF